MRSLDLKIENCVIFFFAFKYMSAQDDGSAIGYVSAVTGYLGCFVLQLHAAPSSSGSSLFGRDLSERYLVGATL